MKKHVIISLVLLFALLGISAAAAVCMEKDTAAPGWRLKGVVETAPDSEVSQCPVQTPLDDAFFLRSGGAQSVLLLARLGETARPLSARLVLSCFEIARILALYSPAEREFLPVPDSHPQVLIWLASCLEVRAGPAAA